MADTMEGAGVDGGDGTVVGVGAMVDVDVGVGNGVGVEVGATDGTGASVGGGVGVGTGVRVGVSVGAVVDVKLAVWVGVGPGWEHAVPIMASRSNRPAMPYRFRALSL